MNLKQKLARLAAMSKAQASRALAVVGASALALPAMAASDFTVPPEISQGRTFVLAIGLAVLGVIVGIAVYRWAKRAVG